MVAASASATLVVAGAARGAAVFSGVVVNDPRSNEQPQRIEPIAIASAEASRRLRREAPDKRSETGLAIDSECSRGLCGHCYLAMPPNASMKNTHPKKNVAKHEPEIKTRAQGPAS